MPEHVTVAGTMIKRNPGVTAVWLTRGWRPFRAHNGVLFKFDDPLDVLWFANGRPATRGEVDESISGGLPFLRAEAEKDGSKGIAALARAVGDAQRYLPAVHS